MILWYIDVICEYIWRLLLLCNDMLDTDILCVCSVGLRHIVETDDCVGARRGDWRI